MRGHNTAVTPAASFTSPLAQQLSEEVTERLVRYARVDTQSSREVLGILDRLNASGRTVVLITHEDEVAAHAMRTVRVVDGRVAGVLV